MPFGSDPFASFLKKRRPAPIDEPDYKPTVEEQFRGTELSLDPFDAFLTKRSRQEVKPYEGSFLPDAWEAVKGAAHQQIVPFDPTELQNKLDPAGRHPNLAAGATAALEQVNSPMGAVLTGSGGLMRGAGAVGQLARGAFRGMSGLAASEGIETALDPDRPTWERALSVPMAALAAAGAAGWGVPMPPRVPRSAPVVPDYFPPRRGRPITDPRRLLGGETIEAGPPQPRLPPGPTRPPQRLLGGEVEPPDPLADMLEFPPEKSAGTITPDEWGDWGGEEKDLPTLGLDETGSTVARPPLGDERARGPRGIGQPPPVTSSEPPLGTQAAPAREGTALGQPAAGIPDDIAVTRTRLQKEGYPPALIDRILADALAGKTVAPKAGTPGTVILPDSPDVLAQRKAAAAAPEPLEQLGGGNREQGEGVLPGGLQSRLRALGVGEEGIRTMPYEDALALVQQNERRGPGRVSGSDEDALYAASRADRIRSAERFRKQPSQAVQENLETSTDPEFLARADAWRQGREGVQSSGGTPPGEEPSRGALQRAATPPGGVGPRPGDPNRPLGGEIEPRSGPPPRDVFAEQRSAESNQRALQRADIEQRAVSRQRHGDTVLFPEYLAEARRTGFTGSDAELKAAFDDKLRAAYDYIDDITDPTQQTQYGRDFLTEIARLGGIHLDRNSPDYGELSTLYESGSSGTVNRTTTGGRAFTGYLPQATIGGVSGVMRTGGGRTLGEMAEALSQDPRWRNHFDDGPNSLLAALDESITPGRIKESDLDVRNALEGMGVKPETRWWERAKGPDEGPGLGEFADDSFDVRQFEDDILSTGEAQPRLPGAEAVRTVETPTPTFDVPFSLGREASSAPTAVETDLFSAKGEAPAADLGTLVSPKMRTFPEAMTVYHGTPETFNTFDPDVATFFSESSDVASRFAAGSNKAQGTSPRVIPAKLNAKDVLDITTAADPQDLQRLADALGGATPNDAANLLNRIRAERNWKQLRSWMQKAGYDAARMPYRKGGNMWMVADPQQASTPWGAPLGSAEPPATQAPRARKIPANVRDFLVKQLGYTDEDIALLSPSELYTLGRDQVRNPAAPVRPERPRAVVTRKAGESYDLAKLGPIEQELEEFLGIEVPRRQQQIAERTERVRQTRGVEARRVHRAETGPAELPSRSVIPIVTRRGAQKSLEAATASERELAADIASRTATVGETKSQRQSRVATIQGEQKRAVREMREAFNRGDYKTYAQKIGEAAERLWTRTKKMGTAVEKDENPFNTLGSGLGMGQAILKDPKKFARMAGEMLANPAIRTAIGAVAGGAIDDDDRMRGALIGAMLAGGTPSGLRAMNRAFKNAKAGKKLFAGAPGEKDLSWWRMAYGQSLEVSVPDAFRKARELELQLEKVFKEPWPDPVKVKAAKYVKREVGAVLADAAVEALEKGFNRKASYLEAAARKYRGQPTKLQKGLQSGFDALFGENAIDAGLIERHSNMLIHRTLIGYSLSSAIRNKMQPILSLLHMAPGKLAAGYKAAGSKAGRELTDFLMLPKHYGEDIVSETRELLGKPAPAKPKGIMRRVIEDPGLPLRKSDELNRRRVFLGALAQKGWLAQALKGGKIPPDVHEWALSIVRKTQGDPGAMSSNPFHRGPIMGPLTRFQKYPGIYLENLVAAFNDPEARGKAFVGAMLGLWAIGQATGIDLGEMMASGAAPLGIDPFHPGETLKRGIRVFPAGRAVMDIPTHLTGTATHPFAALPGEGFLDSDVSELLLGHYPTKFLKKGGEILEQGLGPHLPESVSDTRAAHTGLEDLANLIGANTTRQTESQAATREARRFNERARQQTRDINRDARAVLESAIRSGDRSRILAAEKGLSAVQLRDFYRRRKRSTYERLKGAAPKASRKEFEERFKERLAR
jgi:hypothetical protein